MQGPGTVSQVLANTVIVYGPLGVPVGVFVYQAGTTPGPGNPPTAWMSNQAADPYGNALATGSLGGIGSQLGNTIALLQAGQVQLGSVAFALLAVLNAAGIGGPDSKPVLSISSPDAAGTDVQGILDLITRGAGSNPIVSTNAELSLPKYNILLPTGDTTGVKDFARITLAITDAGDTPATIILAPGTYYTSATIDVNVAQTVLLGSQGVTIQPGSAWTGPDVSGCPVSVTADGCTVGGFTINGQGATSAGQCGGIAVTGAQHCRIPDMRFTNLSWYPIAAIASAGGIPNVDLMITNPVIRNCAAVILAQSNAAASFHGEYFISNLQAQQVGATTGFGANLDAYKIIDVEDVLTDSYNCGIVAGTGSAYHVTGASDGILLDLIDAGTPVAAGAGPVILIDTTPSASPGYVAIGKALTQGGQAGLAVAAGPGGVANTALVEVGIFRSHQSWVSGMQLSSTPTVLLSGAISETANQAGGTGYDFDCSGMASGGTVLLDKCLARTPVGAGAGLVTNPLAVTSQVYVEGCKLLGTGTTPANALTGTPRWVKDTAPVNPRGSITTPVITLGTFTPPASQYNLTVVFDTIGGMTDFQIGGASVGVVPVAGSSFYIEARQTMTVVSAGSVPTWKWFGN